MLLWLARVPAAILGAGALLLSLRAEAQQGAPPSTPPPNPYPYPYPYPYPPQPYPYPPQPPPAQGYPPPGRPEPARERLPDDAAARASPYVDLLVSGYELDERFRDPFSLGGQVGMYVAARLRLAARILFPLRQLSDDNSDSSPSNYQTKRSDPPTLLYAASAGVVVVSTVNFVLSPGILFMRSDKSDYGTVLGLSLPLEWVTQSHLRFGSELGFGRAVGGNIREQCIDVGVFPPPCSPGGVREVDRQGGLALYAHFQIGWAFSYPDPEPAPQPAPSNSVVPNRRWPEAAPRWQGENR
jgi:hypothetical protein